MSRSHTAHEFRFHEGHWQRRHRDERVWRTLVLTRLQGVTKWDWK